MLVGYSKGTIAIVGWHEGNGGQIHALLEAEGVPTDCFVNEQPLPPKIVDPPARPARRFSYPTESSYKGLPLITSSDWIDVLHGRGVSNVVLINADSIVRRRLLREASGKLNLVGYIHPSAAILPEAIVCPGAIILANAVVGYRAEVHQAAFINTGAQIDHNSVVRPCANVFPGAVLCGSVEVGECATIGAGATVLPSIRIGENAFVGAGALVRKNVLSNTRVVGVPARVSRRKKNEGSHGETPAQG